MFVFARKRKCWFLWVKFQFSLSLFGKNPFKLNSLTHSQFTHLCIQHNLSILHSVTRLGNFSNFRQLIGRHMKPMAIIWRPNFFTIFKKVTKSFLLYLKYFGQLFIDLGLDFTQPFRSPWILTSEPTETNSYAHWALFLTSSVSFHNLHLSHKLSYSLSLYLSLSISLTDSSAKTLSLSLSFSPSPIHI